MNTISRRNNFDIIRLLAALQVTIGHGLHILQIGGGGISAQLQISVTYFCSIGLYFLV